MHREIGSEFWEADLGKDCKPISENTYQYLLSGRTALDFIIKDIKVSKEFKTVYLPTYCCHTMIQPFLDNGVTVGFYDVNYSNGRYTYEIDFETQCDAILIMQYFGYCNETVGQIIKQLQDSGKIIIEDATHSWFSDSPYSNSSDYVLSSFRKWTGLPCGAIAIKRNYSFSTLIPIKTNHRYILMRQQAAKLKKQYVEEDAGQKEAFLKLFNLAEELLESDYQSYNIPKEYQDVILRLDGEQIRQKRQANAKHLIEGLMNYKGIECIARTDKDVPLFVPIIVRSGKRKELRKYLINKDVYCPIHWPLSVLHEIKDKYLYENSLSLVCDQRYTIADMDRIIALINEFYGG